MNECCATCKHCYRLEKLDYSEGGCKHTKLDGFICMIFADERIAAWISGLPEIEGDVCEVYEPLENKKQNDCLPEFPPCF